MIKVQSWFLLYFFHGDESDWQMSLLVMELACHMKTVSEVHPCLTKLPMEQCRNAKSPVAEFTTNVASKAVSSMELPE
jgi:hypothetical protein